MIDLKNLDKYRENNRIEAKKIILYRTCIIKTVYASIDKGIYSF